MNKKIKYKISFVLLIALVFSLALPSVAFAAPGDPEESVNVTMEYRYAEGQPIEIPQTINRLGREYRLLSQEPPVLESTLPQSRTYSFRIDGALSKDDYDIVKDLANTTITPVNVEMEREVDKTIVMDMINNDIDDVPLTRQFDVTSASGGTKKATLQRAGVTFDIVKDNTGYPIKYSATVVYRGIETYEDLGYYVVDTTYERQEGLPDVNQYIIVATYEPVDTGTTQLPATISEEPQGGVDEPVQVSVFSEEDLVRLDNQTGNPVTDILSNNVPLGSGAVKDAWSVLSFLISAVGLIFSIVLIISAILSRKKSIETYGEVDSNKNIRLVLKIVAILVGISVGVLWYILDSTSLPMVWINKHTSAIGLVFIAQIAVFVVYSILNKAKNNDAEPPEAAVAA